MCQSGLRHDVAQNGHWHHRFNARRGVIRASVGRELSPEAEVYLSHGVETGVLGPHSRERLSNAAYGTFHGAAADRSAAGINEAAPVSEGKDLQEGDGVGDVTKGRRDGKRVTEMGPEGPMGCSGGGGGSHNALLDIEVCSAEIAEETVLRDGWNSCHGCVCGNVELK